MVRVNVTLPVAEQARRSRRGVTVFWEFGYLNLSVCVYSRCIKQSASVVKCEKRFHGIWRGLFVQTPVLV